MRIKHSRRDLVFSGLVWVFAAALLDGSSARAAEADPSPDYLAAVQQLAQETGRPNAMASYAQAAVSAPVDEANKLSAALTQTLEQGWSAQSAPLAPLFQQCAQAFQLVRQGAALDSAEHPDPGVAGLATPVPNFLNIQILVKLMCAAGKYQESQGKPGVAVGNYLAVTAMGRDFGSKNAPAISRLIGIACQSVAVRSLHGAIISGKVNADGPVGLRQIIQRLEQIQATTTPFSENVAAEARMSAFHLELIRKAAAGEAEAKKALSVGDARGMSEEDFSLYASNIDAMSSASAKTYDLNLAFVKTPAWQRDVAAYKKSLEACDTMFGMFLPGLDYSEAVLREDVKNTQVNLAIVEAALELYRQANNAYPGTLDELYPDALDALPIDPFSGQSLRYRLDGTGYKLWSVGPDRVDQNGAQQYDAKNGTFSAGDVYF